MGLARIPCAPFKHGEWEFLVRTRFRTNETVRLAATSIVMMVDNVIPPGSMKKNVGGYDRIGRFVIGAVLVLAGVTGYVGLFRVAVGPVPQALAALILVLIGVVLLVTGYTQKCPINSGLGLNTYDPSSR